MKRPPSKITPGPEGAWPLDFQTLVGPVVETHCTECHRPDAEGEGKKFDLTPEKSYETLVDYGSPSLREHVLARYRGGRSIAGAGASQLSPLVALLKKGHYDVQLQAEDWARLYTWMDTYAQRQGSFGEEQEQRLRQLRVELAPILAE